jgi:hypothetical protein
MWSIAVQDVRIKQKQFKISSSVAWFISPELYFIKC